MDLYLSKVNVLSDITICMSVYTILFLKLLYLICSDSSAFLWTELKIMQFTSKTENVMAQMDVLLS